MDRTDFAKLKPDDWVLFEGERCRVEQTDREAVYLTDWRNGVECLVIVHRLDVNKF